MIFAAVIANVLLATAAMARPSLKDRVAQRAARSHLSGPKQAVEYLGPVGAGHGNVSHVEYSSNWAGAVYNSAAVSASFH